MSQTCRLIQELRSRPSKRSEEEETGWGQETKEPEAKGSERSRTRHQTSQKVWGLLRHLTNACVRAWAPLILFLRWFPRGYGT